MLTLMILGGVLALLFGIWLGMPGRYEKPSEEEIQRLLENPGTRRKTTQRHFTLMDWFGKKERGSDRRRDRRHFRTAAPRAQGQDATES